jgi:hypothetical protein
VTPEELEAFREDNRYKLEHLRSADRAAKDAANEKLSEIKRQNRASRIMVDGHWFNPLAPHGTLTGYEYWGCCCDKCRPVHAARRRNQLHKTQEKSRGLDR